MAKGLLLTNKGKEVVEFQEGDGREQLSIVKGHIGCDALDAVIFPKDFIAWFDEEGLYKNTYIQRVSMFGYGPTGSIEQDIPGAVLVTGRDDKGSTLGLTKEELEFVTVFFQNKVIGNTQ